MVKKIQKLVNVVCEQPPNVSDYGHTIKATTVLTLVKFCLSYDLQIHKVTPFRSLKVRFDNLISRKIDLFDKAS